MARTIAVEDLRVGMSIQLHRGWSPQRFYRPGLRIDQVVALGQRIDLSPAALGLAAATEDAAA